MNGRSTQMNTKGATRWVLVLTGIGSLMVALDTLVVSTALSTIRLDLALRSSSWSGRSMPTT